MPKGGEGSGMFIDDGIIAWFDGPEWDEVAQQAFADAATRVEGVAQQNAPWEDQTGDARANLKAQATVEGGDVILTLEHGVEYGLWLEVIQSGAFAIIMPTLESEGPGIMDEVARKVASARKGRG